MIPAVFHRLCVVGCCLFLQAVAAFSAEVRTWTSTEGKTLQGTLVKIDGENVMIKMTDGRVVPVAKTRLSEPDLRYLKDNAVGQPKPSAAASSKANRALTAKEVKVDAKAFEKKKKGLDIGSLVFDVIDTPHFCVAYLGNVSNPEGTAESAERLWQEMSSQFASFSQNWGNKRLAILLAEKNAHFEAIGKWSRETLNKAHPDDEKVRQRVVTSAATWSASSSHSIELDAEFVQKYNTLQDGVVISISDPTVNKGLWAPFRINVLAEHLLGFQAGGTASFTTGEGDFMIFDGYGYFKEIQLCGRSECALVNAQYEDLENVKTTEGFGDSKEWSRELKSTLRRGTISMPPLAKGGKEEKLSTAEFASLDRLAKLDRKKLRGSDIALAYALIGFMQSTPERMEAFDKLIESSRSNKRVPEAGAIAATFGIADKSQFEAAWLSWMKSPQFK